ncbi:MAG: hypothetical protein RL154_473, partial [Pseudomonadota bacterium]|jgi:methyl-accepting chemotaxis protein
VEYRARVTNAAASAMVERLKKLIELQVQNSNDLEDESENGAKLAKITIVSTSIMLVLLTTIIAALIIRNLIYSMNTLQNGLLDFFKFLGNEIPKTETIKLDSQDEFGQMAKVINKHIEIIETNVLQDNAFIADVKRLAREMKDGHFLAQVNLDATTPALQELKAIFNDVKYTIEHKVARDLNLVFQTLDSYGRYDFTARIPNAYGQVAVAINRLGDEISSMLANNLSNGLALQAEAIRLSTQTEELSTSSGEQAASLEETSANIEEMSSNLNSTTAKAQEMTNIAHSTKLAAIEGMKLTDTTVDMMDAIFKATSAISDAVAIINNIAFQTNILSLNAAVEAATAGEAGKGFSVVAGEVRNLAAKSADAAKQIQDLTSKAQAKALDGKSATDNMQKALRELTSKIDATFKLIEDVTATSKEQMNGIKQINYAVSQLDSMAQQNTSIANVTSAVAESVSSMANGLVFESEGKQFAGKLDVKQKAHYAEVSHAPSRQEAKASPTKQILSKQHKPTPALHDDSRWDSF